MKTKRRDGKISLWLKVFPPNPDVLCLIPQGRQIIKSKIPKTSISHLCILTTAKSLFSLKCVIFVNKIQVIPKPRRQISFPLLCNKLPQWHPKTTNICYPNIKMRCHVDQNSRCGLAGCL